MNEYKLSITQDGSHTIYIADMDEYFHSMFGAISESLYIFIHSGFNVIDIKQIKILEIGFGTGLNAWLTLISAVEQKRKVYYTSYELHPVESSLIQNLNYTNVYESKFKEEFLKLHEAKWEQKVAINDFFILHKIKADITKAIISGKFDLIYYDAFSPSKQPEMWTLELLKKVSEATNLNGCFVTYCAKGEVRRKLQASNFTIERLNGPPGGKREILRGFKHNSNIQPS